MDNKTTTTAAKIVIIIAQVRRVLKYWLIENQMFNDFCKTYINNSPARWKQCLHIKSCQSKNLLLPPIGYLPFRTFWSKCSLHWIDRLMAIQSHMFDRCWKKAFAGCQIKGALNLTVNQSWQRRLDPKCYENQKPKQLNCVCATMRKIYRSRYIWKKLTKIYGSLLLV